MSRFVACDIECDQPSGDIIQVGAVLWDTDQGQIDSFNMYAYALVNWDYPIRGGAMTLGGLLPFGQSTLDQYGAPRGEVLAAFSQWVVECKTKTIVQWGSGDMDAIQSQGAAALLPRLDIIDTKLVYKTMIKPMLAFQKPKQSGLSAVYKAIFGTRDALIKEWHDALADATATAELHAYFLKLISIGSRTIELVQGKQR